MATPKVTQLKLAELQPEATSRSMVASWTWGSPAETDHYEVLWQYSTGVGMLIPGSESNVDPKFNTATWSAPASANAVRVQVKAISKTHKVNGQDSLYWNHTDYSAPMIYYFDNNPPVIPPTPTVELDTNNKCKLNISITGMAPQDPNLKFEDAVNFKIIQIDANNVQKVYKTGTSNITWNGTDGSAYYSLVVAGGYTYRVQAQSRKGERYGQWSSLSSGVKTAPDTGIELKTCKVQKVDSEHVVYLKWTISSTADVYRIRYATNEAYFDSSDNVTVIDIDEQTDHRNVTGLSAGQTYYFQVCAGNSAGYGPWSNTMSATVGAKPAIPTTWSDVTSAIAESGSHVTLYWRHNPKDGSKETKATIGITLGNNPETYITITDPLVDDDDDAPHSYQYSTASIQQGTKIKWRVKTAGADQTQFSDWSITREIDVYTRPLTTVQVKDISGDDIGLTLTKFPINIDVTTTPASQKPIGYSVDIIANSTYETRDSLGKERIILAGNSVYSNYFIPDTEPSSRSFSSWFFRLKLSAGDVDLNNAISYTVKVEVTMDSGLRASDDYTFTVSWDENSYEPNAEISVDPETLIANIHPYCKNSSGNLISGVTLSVYRREFNGDFTEIATDIPNSNRYYVTDPHPALDYARYRIVSRVKATGAIGFNDLAGYPVGEKAVIIQWDETWTNFDGFVSNAVTDAVESEPPWSGSMLKLPYNIDISESTSPEVSMINYIGRSHPVAYYGTQKGETRNINLEVPHYDTETIYQLRRLSVWMGDVYIRDPSGAGYWANVKVSFNKNHNKLTVPVSLSITRVEGGA